MIEDKKEENTVVANAMRAFGCLTTAKSVLEVYASFGILLGKFAEFASLMKDKQVKEQDEDSKCEEQGKSVPENDKGSD